VGANDALTATGYANCKYNTYSSTSLTAVNDKTPNSLDLYQMTGNAHKFMWDVLSETSSGFKGVRGGNYTMLDSGVAIDNYYGQPPDDNNGNIAIRVAANSVGE
jgi:hypothetical protein